MFPFLSHLLYLLTLLFGFPVKSFPFTFVIYFNSTFHVETLTKKYGISESQFLIKYIVKIFILED